MKTSHTFQNLHTLVEQADHDSFRSESERRNAVQLAHKLLSTIERPWESASRLLMVDPFAIAALKTLNNLGLFRDWQPLHSSKTLPELTQSTGCETRLLYRLLLSMLSNHWMHYSISDQTFSLTPFTQALQDPSFAAAFSFHDHVVSPAATALPDFLAVQQYINPIGDPQLSLWHYASGSELVPWFQTHPEAFRSLHHVMDLRGKHSENWTEFYPWKEQIVEWIEEANDDGERAVAFVDMGGGTGQDSLALYRKSPRDFPVGSIIVQDLPEVVQRITKRQDQEKGNTSPISHMAHDFFLPQPIRGARIYFMHLVLHDWSDERAKEILFQNLRPAMERGHSRLLINDIVLEAASGDPMVSGSDLHMMMNGAQERTKKEWQMLLEESGFRIRNWYFSPLSEQALIEAELA